MKSRTPVLVIALMSLGYHPVASQSRSLAKTIDTTHHSVVAILRVDSSGREFVAGSGVLIHSRVVLTAGHVNFDGTSQAPGGSRTEGFVSFSSNALEMDDRVQFDWLKDVESHPDAEALLNSFSDTTGLTDPYSFADVGLIFLRQPVANKPLARLPAPRLLSDRTGEEPLLGVGFGYHEVPDSTFADELVDGLRRKWRLDAASLANDLWLKAGCDSLTNLPFISAHDSGAPLFFGEDVVVGVWSMVNTAVEPCPYSSWAVRVDNPSVLAWIRERIKARIGSDLN